MRKIARCFFVMIIAGCVSSKGRVPAKDISGNIINEIIKTTQLYNDTTKTYKVRLHFKAFFPTEEIFRKLAKDLKNSQHLIYLFTWDNDLPTITHNFKAIIVDKTTGRKFYANKTTSQNTVQIGAALPQDFVVADFLLDKYDGNQHDFLRTLQNRFDSTQIRHDIFIYEVNLSTHNSKLLVLNAVAVFAQELKEANGS